MKKTETKTVTKECMVTVAVVCDLCGASKKPNENPDKGRWAAKYDGHTGYPALEEVTIKYDGRVSYPDFQSGERLNLDVCPACWREKVWPFLKTLNPEMETEIFDY